MKKLAERVKLKEEEFIKLQASGAKIAQEVISNFFSFLNKINNSIIR